MRTASTLAVLAITAVAAMAAMAPAASGTAALEVVYEAPGGAQHCPALPIGCDWHDDGEIRFYFHIFGVESTEIECHIEMEGRINEVGQVLVDSIALTQGGHADSNCATSMVPCSGTLPWPGDSEEDLPEEVDTHLDPCLDPAESGANCTGEGRIRATEETDLGTGVEVQHLRATDIRIGNSLCEFDLDVESESLEHDRLHYRFN